jgi:hypothetical protein
VISSERNVDREKCKRGCVGSTYKERNSHSLRTADREAVRMNRKRARVGVYEMKSERKMKGNDVCHMSHVNLRYNEKQVKSSNTCMEKV